MSQLEEWGWGRHQAADALPWVPRLGSFVPHCSTQPWNSPPWLTHHLLVGFPKKCFGKDRDDEDIDDEGDEERNAGFNEEVFVGLPDLPLVGAVHLSGLETAEQSSHQLWKVPWDASTLESGQTTDSVEEERPELSKQQLHNL